MPDMLLLRDYRYRVSSPLKNHSLYTYHLSVSAALWALELVPSSFHWLETVQSHLESIHLCVAK